MTTTIIYGDLPSTVEGARTDGSELWLGTADLKSATGWEIKPEGICRDDVCIPVPAGKHAAFLNNEGQQTWFNLAEFARHVGQPVAHDDGAGVWYFGVPADERRNALLDLEAPDFTLPDLGGELHSLSAQRGKKVLLMLWASW